MSLKAALEDMITEGCGSTFFDSSDSKQAVTMRGWEVNRDKILKERTYVD